MELDSWLGWGVSQDITAMVLGVEKNKKKAIGLYHRAGIPWELAGMFQAGEGVRVNYEKPIHYWYIAGISLDGCTAHCELANIFETAKGYVGSLRKMTSSCVIEMRYFIPKSKENRRRFPWESYTVRSVARHRRGDEEHDYEYENEYRRGCSLHSLARTKREPADLHFILAPKVSVYQHADWQTHEQEVLQCCSWLRLEASIHEFTPPFQWKPRRYT